MAETFPEALSRLLAAKGLVAEVQPLSNVLAALLAVVESEGVKELAGSDTFEALVLYLYDRRFGWSERSDPHAASSSELPSALLASKRVLNENCDRTLSLLSEHLPGGRWLDCVQHTVNSTNKPVVRQQAFAFLFKWVKSRLPVDSATEWVKIQNLLLAGLTDVWSAIRKSCGTRLYQTMDRFTLTQTELLFQDISMVAATSSKWKSVEGAVLGMTAIIKRFRRLQPVGGAVAASSSSSSSSSSVARFSAATSVSPPPPLAQASSSSTLTSMSGKKRLDSEAVPTKKVTRISACILPAFVATTIRDVVYPLLRHPQLSVRKNAVNAFAAFISRSESAELTQTFNEVLQQLDQMWIPGQAGPGGGVGGGGRPKTNKAMVRPGALALGLPKKQRRVSSATVRGDNAVRSAVVSDTSAASGLGSDSGSGSSLSGSSSGKLMRSPAPFLRTNTAPHGSLGAQSNLLPDYAADGLLSMCIVLTKIAPATLLLSRRENMFNTCLRYLAHEASTVRQTASSVFQHVVAKATVGNASLQLLPLVMVALTKDTNVASSSTSSSSWEIREGRMLCYELIVQYLLEEHRATITPSLPQGQGSHSSNVSPATNTGSTGPGSATSATSNVSPSPSSADRHGATPRRAATASSAAGSASGTGSRSGGSMRNLSPGPLDVSPSALDARLVAAARQEQQQQRTPTPSKAGFHRSATSAGAATARGMDTPGSTFSAASVPSPTCSTSGVGLTPRGGGGGGGFAGGLASHAAGLKAQHLPSPSPSSRLPVRMRIGSPGSTRTSLLDEMKRLDAAGRASARAGALTGGVSSSSSSTSDGGSGRGRKRQRVSFASVLAQVLTQTRACLGSSRFELSRMAMQLLPPLTHLCCWYDISLVADTSTSASAMGTAADSGEDDGGQNSISSSGWAGIPRQLVSGDLLTVRVSAETLRAALKLGHGLETGHVVVDLLDSPASVLTPRSKAHARSAIGTMLSSMANCLPVMLRGIEALLGTLPAYAAGDGTGAEISDGTGSDTAIAAVSAATLDSVRVSSLAVELLVRVQVIPLQPASTGGAFDLGAVAETVEADEAETTSTSTISSGGGGSSSSGDVGGGGRVSRAEGRRKLVGLMLKQLHAIHVIASSTVGNTHSQRGGGGGGGGGSDGGERAAAAAAAAGDAFQLQTVGAMKRDRSPSPLNASATAAHVAVQREARRLLRDLGSSLYSLLPHFASLLFADQRLALLPHVLRWLVQSVGTVDSATEKRLALIATAHEIFRPYLQAAEALIPSNAGAGNGQIAAAIALLSPPPAPTSASAAPTTPASPAVKRGVGLRINTAPASAGSASTTRRRSFASYGASPRSQTQSEADTALVMGELDNGNLLASVERAVRTILPLLEAEGLEPSVVKQLLEMLHTTCRLVPDLRFLPFILARLAANVERICPLSKSESSRSLVSDDARAMMLDKMANLQRTPTGNIVRRTPSFASRLSGRLHLNSNEIKRGKEWGMKGEIGVSSPRLVDLEEHEDEDKDEDEEDRSDDAADSGDDDDWDDWDEEEEEDLDGLITDIAAFVLRVHETFPHAPSPKTTRTSKVILNKHSANELFVNLDGDKDGKLSPQEVKSALTAHLGRSLSDKDILQVVSAVDRNNDGHIDLSEFTSHVLDIDSTFDTTTTTTTTTSFSSLTGNAASANNSSSHLAEADAPPPPLGDVWRSMGTQIRGGGSFDVDGKASAIGANAATSSFGGEGVGAEGGNGGTGTSGVAQPPYSRPARVSSAQEVINDMSMQNAAVISWVLDKTRV